MNWGVCVYNRVNLRRKKYFCIFRELVRVYSSSFCSRTFCKCTAEAPRASFRIVAIMFDPLRLSLWCTFE